MKIFNTPNEEGFFGEFGGMFVPEELKGVLREVDDAFKKYSTDKDFLEELNYYYNQYIGRPTPLYYAEEMTKDLKGAKVYLKREDLCHMGAHKLNNVIGQILIAKRMGKKRVIAETGAGQHGVATACAAARFGMECVIYMGDIDKERQALNVFRMEMMGATVKGVSYGTKTLKEAVDEAFMDFVQNKDNTFYVVGSAVGPHPYPHMVKFFQSVIGREAREQILKAEGKLPDYVIACIGGGSNAIGIFNEFIGDTSVKLIGAEGAGKGIDSGLTAATITIGKEGILHGFNSYVMKDEKGEVAPAYSISAGLDYPGIGPEHAYLAKIGREKAVPITDDEAVNALKYLSKTEGIIPALESSHAIAAALKLVPTLSKDKLVIVNLSGRGDKDVQQIMNYHN